MIKKKREGFGLEIKTFHGEHGSYLVFRTAQGSFHAFIEVEAKDAARDCGATEEKTTRAMWADVWNDGA